MDTDDIVKLITELDKQSAIVVVRIDSQDERIEQLAEGHKWMTRLIISTLISVVIGVALAALGVVLAL